MRAISQVLVGNTFTGCYTVAVLRALNSATIGWCMKIHLRPTLLFLGNAVRKAHIPYLQKVKLKDPRQRETMKTKSVIAEIFPFITEYGVRIMLPVGAL